MKLYVKNYLIGELKDFEEIKETLNRSDKSNINSKVLLQLNKNYNAIQNVINSLNEEEKRFYELYFKEKYDRTAVCYKMHFELSTFYRIKNKIIYKLATELGLS